MLHSSHQPTSDMPTFIVYKPFGMLCQFTPEQAGQVTLADLPSPLPPKVYPVGRLDADSEGLLLISDDNSLNNKYLNPKNSVEKTYWAQVEGQPTEADLEPLRVGLDIKVDGKVHHTRPAKAHILDPVPLMPDRVPPIRFRASIPDTWISLTITEGKNRQVRRMCAAIGFPVLRLVRVAIGPYRWGEGQLVDLMPGQVVLVERV
jgi:23S rRNA pseudouridine2457 synthase